ncbi:hypothetical protein FACS1894184_03610 [Clostridia bacterium]|nr:hypothetical protein FACS1894184_03610 [Clostridia bacterium]
MIPPKINDSMRLGNVFAITNESVIILAPNAYANKISRTKPDNRRTTKQRVIIAEFFNSSMYFVDDRSLYVSAFRNYTILSI